MSSVIEKLNAIYEKEQSVCIRSFHSFSDYGWHFRLGDEINGFKAEYWSHSFEDGVNFLYANMLRYMRQDDE